MVLRLLALAGGCFDPASPSGLVGAIPFASSSRLLAAKGRLPGAHGSLSSIGGCRLKVVSAVFIHQFVQFAVRSTPRI